MKNKSIKQISFLAMNIFSLIIGIVLIIINTKPEYKLITLLPFSFSLISCINIRIYSLFFKRVSITLVILIYFFRMVLLPFIMVIEEYGTLVLNSQYLNYINIATFLMIYEFFCVMLFGNLKLKKEFKIIEYKDSNKKNNFRFFNILLLILVMIVIIFINIYPQLLNYLNIIFSQNLESNIEKNINFNIMKTEVPNYIYYGATFLINILQVLIPIYLINIVYNSKWKEKHKLLISFIIIMATAIITTTEVAHSYIIAIALSLVLAYIYPSKVKIILKMIFIIGGIGIMYGLLIKSGLLYKNVNFSSIFQAYFSGINNVAVSFLIPSNIELKIFLNDILKSIPFVTAFFPDLSTTVNIYNYYLYNANDRVDQIIPMIGQSMCYFGIVLSPMLSVISVSLAIKFENKMLFVNDMINKYVYLLIVIVFAISPVVYNFTILIQNVLGLLLPVWLISRFIIRKK